MIANQRFIPTCVTAIAILISCHSANADAVEAEKPGEVLGHIELVSGVPAQNCLAILEGTPLGAKCDAEGTFHLRRIPAGVWTMKIVVEVADGSQLTLRRDVGPNAGETSDLGAIVMSRPLTVGGRVLGINASNYSDYFVSAPSLDIAATLSPSGTYLMTGLPPGSTEIQVQRYFQENGRVSRRRSHVAVFAKAGAIVIGDDLDISLVRGEDVRVPESKPPDGKKPDRGN